jgi:hypothetical protein
VTSRAGKHLTGAMGKVPNHKAKKGHNKKGPLAFKQAARGRFLNRHIDQVRAAERRPGSVLHVHVTHAHLGAATFARRMRARAGAPAGRRQGEDRGIGR